MSLIATALSVALLCGCASRSQLCAVQWIGQNDSGVSVIRFQCQREDAYE